MCKNSLFWNHFLCKKIVHKKIMILMVLTLKMGVKINRKARVRIVKLAQIAKMKMICNRRIQLYIILMSILMKLKIKEILKKRGSKSKRKKRIPEWQYRRPWNHKTVFKIKIIYRSNLKIIRITMSLLRPKMVKNKSKMRVTEEI